jgi:SAM-dependent methyltransferase
LDVGSGDGRVAHHLSQLRQDVEVCGLDVFVRPNALIPTGQFDGENIPFENASWDIVLLVDVLHHTNDPASLLREAARIAREAVIVKDHLCQSAIDRRLLSVMDWVGNAGHGVVLPYNYLSHAEWQNAFDFAGLKVESDCRRLELYSAPVDAVCGRSLHFLARLRPSRRGDHQ